MFAALLSSALIFVFCCIVETFAFRVTAQLTDPKPVTLQDPCVFLNILLGYMFYCLLMRATKTNKIVCTYLTFLLKKSNKMKIKNVLPK